MKYVLKILLLISLIAFCLVTLLYMFNFFPFTKIDISFFGQTGDFFGGMLNPIYSFLGLIAILLTLKQTEKALMQNQEAIEISKQELIETRKEITKSQELLRLQVTEFQKKRSLDDIEKSIKNLDETFWGLYLKSSPKYYWDVFVDRDLNKQEYIPKSSKQEDHYPDPHIARIVESIMEIFSYLQCYDNIFGTENMFSAHYKKKYRIVILSLSKRDYFSADVRNYFLISN